mmetsp:Transcript_64957/g.115592  ORF Transcript_64957/g.115592 Transcript_64957/m.115592 type:complete len:452 (+) Transcript_64957:475-1830(+)
MLLQDTQGSSVAFEGDPRPGLDVNVGVAGVGGVGFDADQLIRLLVLARKVLSQVHALRLQLPQVGDPLRVQLPRVLLLQRELLALLLQVGGVLGSLAPHLGLMGGELDRGLLRGPLCSLGQVEVLDVLLLLLCFAVEAQLRPGLDGRVVHRLQLLAAFVAAEYHLVDGVADAPGPVQEHGEGRQLAELPRALQERLERVCGAKLDHVGRHGVDKVPERVLGGIQHGLHVVELVEDHQLDHKLGVVRRAHVLHVVVQLVRERRQLLELASADHVPLVLRVLGMPVEGVHPLLGGGNEPQRPADRPPRHGRLAEHWLHGLGLGLGRDAQRRASVAHAVPIRVDDDRLECVQEDRVVDSDVLVDDGIQEDSAGAMHVLLAAIPEADHEVLLLVGHEAVQEPDVGSPDDDVVRALHQAVLPTAVPHRAALALLHAPLAERHVLVVGAVAERHGHR